MKYINQVNMGLAVIGAAIVLYALSLTFLSSPDLTFSAAKVLEAGAGPLEPGGAIMGASSTASVGAVEPVASPPSASRSVLGRNAVSAPPSTAVGAPPRNAPPPSASLPRSISQPSQQRAGAPSAGAERSRAMTVGQRGRAVEATGTVGADSGFSADLEPGYSGVVPPAAGGPPQRPLPPAGPPRPGAESEKRDAGSDTSPPPVRSSMAPPG